MNFTEKICRMIALGLYDRLTTPKLPYNINRYVAAGNPGKTFPGYPCPVSLPETFTMGKKRWQKREFTTYTVSGGSMLPDGIRSGYELLTLPARVNEIEVGDFIVIAVDEEFYKYRHNGLSPHFKFKLRRAIGVIAQNVTVEELCGKLKGTFGEVLDEKEKNDLGDSLEEARNFYRNESLFLSVTYHDGDIHYSFHPSVNIRGRLEGVAYNINGSLVFKQAMELVA